MPPWQELADSPPPREEEPERTQHQVGWQQRASRKLEKFLREEWPGLSNSSRALLRSQHGPLASAPLTALPTSKATRVDAQPFRVFLCRRLHLPLPLSMRACRCAANLTNLAIIVQRASWQGCWGEGASRWRWLRPKCAERLELGFPPTSTSGTWTWPNLDGRRLEVVADGLTLWHGAQLAIDTTLLSPLRRDGSARPRAADHDGAALDDARRHKERTYPELSGDGGRARLVVLAAEVGGRWSVETANFWVSLSKAKALDSPYVLQGRVQQAFIRRWSALLACSAVRALSASVLDRRPVPDLGVIPSVNEVGFV